MLAALALAVVVLAPPGSQDLEVRSPDFATDRTILRGTSDGLQRSDDGGSSWEPIELPGTGAVNAIEFEAGFSHDGYVLVLRGGTTAAMSRNGKRDFLALPVPPGGRLNDVLLGSGFALRGAMTMACGTAGVWSSDDYGETWEPDGQGLPDDDALELSSERNTEGRLVQFALLARSGTYRRVDAGEWEPTGTPPIPAPPQGRTPAKDADTGSDPGGLPVGVIVGVAAGVLLLLVVMAGRRGGATS